MLTIGNQVNIARRSANAKIHEKHGGVLFEGARLCEPQHIEKSERTGQMFIRSNREVADPRAVSSSQISTLPEEFAADEPLGKMLSFSRIF
jgi:hypothetical protein